MKRRTMDYQNAYYVSTSLHRNAGLCNQLFILANAMVECAKLKKNTLFVDRFLLEAYTSHKCIASRIFDFPRMNQLLSEKYGFVLKDADPASKNGKIVQSIISSIPECSDNINTILGNDIVKSIHFNTRLETYVNTIVRAVDTKTSNKVNVVHLRMEDDACAHWGQVNGMAPHDFSRVLAQHYIDLIKRYIKDDETTIVLTGNIRNPVIEFLKLKNYRYFVCKKISIFREMNAIVDLCAGKTCNNVFIGAGGSTFTQTLCVYLNNTNVICKTINLNELKTPENNGSS
jgi:hypothetical protein